MASTMLNTTMDTQKYNIITLTLCEIQTLLRQVVVAHR